jgi:hypothetical protein
LVCALVTAVGACGSEAATSTGDGGVTDGDASARGSDGGGSTSSNGGGSGSTSGGSSGSSNGSDSGSGSASDSGSSSGSSSGSGSGGLPEAGGLRGRLLFDECFGCGSQPSFRFSAEFNTQNPCTITLGYAHIATTTFAAGPYTIAEKAEIDSLGTVQLQ